MKQKTAGNKLDEVLADAENRIGNEWGKGELHWISFPQVWSSTALGFERIGGRAMTTAQTTVITYGDKMMVYFGNEWAYSVPTELGNLWINKKRFPSVKEYHELANNTT